MRDVFRIALLLAFACSIACKLEVPQQPAAAHVIGTGIDLEISNGQPSPLTLTAGDDYYVDQLALRVSALHFPTPDAIGWLQQQSDFSHLSWADMIGLGQEWEAADGSFSASRTHHDAAWMKQRHEFTLRLLDDAGAPLGDPVALSRSGFLMTKLAAFSWLDGAPAVDDPGQNTITAAQVAVTAGGTFLGQADDIYLLEVTGGGPMDGTATVDITSVRGDDSTAIAVLDGLPFDISAAGLGLAAIFTDQASGTELVAGDRWVIRASPGEAGVAEPGTRALYGATANIIFQIGSENAQLFAIPANTASIELTWAARPESPYQIPVTMADPPEVGFGLEVGVTVAERYEPGDTVEVTIQLTDDAGTPLHSPDALPSYGEFAAGQANGILYYDFRRPEEPCEVGNDCRENLMYVRVAGPRHLGRQAYTAAPIPGFFNEGGLVPDFGIIFGGFANPDLWDLPIPNQYTFELPDDAEPGTYSVIVKAHREHLGETSYVMEVVPFQVGTDEETEPQPGTIEACILCHVADSSLERLRHGTSESYVCNRCHQPPHGTAAEIIHHIHFQSNALPVSRNDCSVCHLKPQTNRRASVAVCGSCHGLIHEGEFELQEDRYAECGTNCHSDQPAGHVFITPR